MNQEEKLKLIEDWLARPMTDEEKEIARMMLAEESGQFAGSNSPGFIARKLDMYRKTGKKPEAA